MLKKILLISPYGIGDVLFTTPVLQAIKQAHPRCAVGYWINERVQDLFLEDPLVSYVYPLSRGDLKRAFETSVMTASKRVFQHFAGLRAARFDAAINFSIDNRYTLLCALAGIQQRAGYDYRGRGRFLTAPVRIDSFNDRHMADSALGLLEPFGIARPDLPRFRLHVHDGAHAKAQAVLSRLKVLDAEILIGIAGGAGASWGKDAALKHWPAVRFAQLIDAVHDNLPAKVILLGSEAERPIADCIIGMARTKPVDLVGRTSIGELAAIMSYLKVLVTNDGGPLHMAAALDVRTVSIFGPVDSRVYGPYPPGPDHIVIQNEIECRPCYKDFRMPECFNGRACISGIETAVVFDAVKKLAA